MDIITTIEYFLAAMTGLYLLGLVVVWVYELRRNALYRRMREEVRRLESAPSSMAVLTAKTYKVTQDYHRSASRLEMVQQFILKNVLLIGNNHRLLSSLPSRTGRR